MTGPADTAKINDDITIIFVYWSKRQCSVLPTGRLFGRISQEGPNKNQSGWFCTERAIKGHQKGKIYKDTEFFPRRLNFSLVWPEIPSIFICIVRIRILSRSDQIRDFFQKFLDRIFTFSYEVTKTMSLMYIIVLNYNKNTLNNSDYRKIGNCTILGRLSNASEWLFRDEPLYVFNSYDFSSRVM